MFFSLCFLCGRSWSSLISEQVRSQEENDSKLLSSCSVPLSFSGVFACQLKQNSKSILTIKKPSLKVLVVVCMLI